jgi:DNA-binding transcriptional LysR family regulator
MPRPPNLSLELLRTFTTLVGTRGDALAAAEKLGINQPSMSKRLRYLQHKGDVLDRPWVMREGKAWQLTEAGQEVLPAVEEIVRRYEQLARLVSEPKPSIQQVSFACGSLAAGVVRGAVRRFREQHPSIRPRISTSPGILRIRGVAMGSLDLALVTQSRATIRRIARRRLSIEPLETEHLVLVCADSSPWAQRVGELKGKVTPAALKDFPLILPEPDTGLRRRLDRILQEHQVLDELDIAMEVGGWKAILEHVRDGSGVGILSDAALPESDRLIVQPLDPRHFPPTEVKLICRLQLARPDERDLSPHAEAFRQLLLAAAKEGPRRRAVTKRRRAKASSVAERTQDRRKQRQQRQGGQHDGAAHASSR